MGMGVQRHAPAILPREIDPVPKVQQGGWALGPVWTCVENHAPTEIRSPDRPARSESLYRLSYSGPKHLCSTDTKMAEGHKMKATQIRKLLKCLSVC